MKTIKFPRSTIRKIHSMHELQLEQARVKLELVKTEDKIKASYRHFLSAFSLRNIFSTVTTEFISPSSILSNVIVLGKNWLSKRKKKKKGAKASEKTDEKVSSDG